MTTITVDQMFTLARQLPQRERMRLIAMIVQDLVIEPPPTPGDAWGNLFATMDAVAAAPLVAGRSATADVTESRR